MKKRNIVFAVAASLAMASALMGCSETEMFVTPEQEHSAVSEITFSNMLPAGGTRTSITSQTGFPVGTSMAVYGFQTTGQDVDLILNNQEVIHVDATKWVYDPVKFWNIGSTYEFYGLYPHSIDYTFDTSSKLYSISNFTVADQVTDQIDVMISKKNTTYPFNLVTLDFNHLLSKVNFYMKVSSSYDFTANKVTKIELVSFDITGIKNQGSYNQSGYYADGEQAGNVKGDWTVSTGSADYDYPELTSGTLDGSTPQFGIGTDLLLLPQDLAGAQMHISYRIFYNDNSSMLQTKNLALNTAKGSRTSQPGVINYIRNWQPDFIYNYYLSVDPSKRNTTKIDWDGSLDGDEVVDPDADLKGPDANGDYWVLVDTDGDGTPDNIYPVVWEDIDGDGKLEGGIDSDGDNHIDNVDGGNSNPDDKDNVTDGKNTDGKDGILVYDPETDTWQQLEKDENGNVTPEIDPDHAIEFSATVTDWVDSYNSDAQL